MIRFYKVAGMVIRVIVPDEYAFSETVLLQKYAVKECKHMYTMKFCVSEELPKPLGKCTYKEAGLQIHLNGEVQMCYKGAVQTSVSNAYLCIVRKGTCSIVHVKKSSVHNEITSKIVLNAMELEHLIAVNKGVVLHASYIEWQDSSILFTAPSGTGKSTQADLWCAYAGAKLINGDRAAVLIKENGIMAAGIPFSGSSGVGENKTFPLKAIVYLAKNEVNQLEKLQGITGFRRVWEGCSVNVWNKEDVVQTMETVDKIVSEIPVYLLRCRKDESAVAVLREELERQEQYEK